MPGIAIVLLGILVGSVATWLAQVVPGESADVPYGLALPGLGLYADVDVVVLGATLGALFGAALAGALV